MAWMVEVDGERRPVPSLNEVAADVGQSLHPGSLATVWPNGRPRQGLEVSKAPSGWHLAGPARDSSWAEVLGLHLRHRFPA